MRQIADGIFVHGGPDLGGWHLGGRRAYARPEGLQPTITQCTGNSGGLRVGQKVPISGSLLRILTSQTLTDEKVDHHRMVQEL
jgi:hypothetical protein